MNEGASALLSGEHIAALELSVGAAAMPVLAVDLDGRVAYLNARARERWRDALGTPATELVPEGERAAFSSALAEVLGGRAPPEHATYDGDRYDLVTLSPLRAGARIAGALVVVTEVTALKREEVRLRHSEQLMVDTQGTVHLGMWEWDVRKPTATWSDELYRIYGLTPETYTPTYEGYLEMVHPDDRQRVIDATNRVFHQHVPYSHDERILRPDGSIRYLHTWAKPILDEDGTLVRLIGMCQDITDRKLAEEEVRKLNQDLEARVIERTAMLASALRDVEAFNAMVSHDLRAPLSVIQLNADLLRNSARELPPAFARGLEGIEESVRHMSALVSDLLVLVRVGHAPLARAEVDLTALTENVVEELRRSAPSKRSVEVRVESSLSVVADRGLMRAALTNLLGNAWKYSSRVPHPRIEVGREGSSFFVRDNGAGFDMKDRERLFVPFQRLHSDAEFPGTGIGLATVQKIVERHGGRVWAVGEKDRGATFYFEI